MRLDTAIMLIKTSYKIYTDFKSSGAFLSYISKTTRLMRLRNLAEGVIVSDFYSKGYRFKSWLVHVLSLGLFMALHSPSRIMPQVRP
jgi:hypothetical protein